MNAARADRLADPRNGVGDTIRRFYRVGCWNQDDWSALSCFVHRPGHLRPDSRVDMQDIMVDFYTCLLRDNHVYSVAPQAPWEHSTVLLFGGHRPHTLCVTLM